MKPKSEINFASKEDSKRFVESVFPLISNRPIFDLF